MKKFIATLIILFTASNIMAAERKPVGTISTDDFTSDTQVAMMGSGDNHLAIAWWVPLEFWESILSRDSTTSAQDKKALLDAVADVSLLGIVQADVSSLGAFSYYSLEDVESNLDLIFKDFSGNTQKLLPLKSINPDLEIVLGIFKPILKSAMGNLGDNFHFYVLGDKLSYSHRLIDPYKNGKISVKLSKKNGEILGAEIETPLNCLFVPRKCPNGKDAHISWNYCPWTGSKLK